MGELKIKIKKLKEGATLPRYETAGASGMDVRVCLENAGALSVAPLERVKVPTGLAFEIPEGFELQVRPRSGLAAVHGLTVLNAPGTIDADYRGELCVILVNLGTERYTIHDGERIAHLVAAPVCRAALLEANELEQSARGAGGFGSTGGFGRAEQEKE
jgi:dUTP pyrophosphatase